MGSLQETSRALKHPAQTPQPSRTLASASARLYIGVCGCAFLFLLAASPAFASLDCTLSVHSNLKHRLIQVPLLIWFLFFRSCSCDGFFFVSCFVMCDDPAAPELFTTPVPICCCRRLMQRHRKMVASGVVGWTCFHRGVSRSVSIQLPAHQQQAV